MEECFDQCFGQRGRRRSGGDDGGGGGCGGGGRDDGVFSGVNECEEECDGEEGDE